MRKRKSSHRKHTHHPKAQKHELIFAFALAGLVSMLGLYAYLQMFTFRVAAAPHP